MKFRFFNILAVATVLSSPAMAADALAPLNFKGIYECNFSGLLIGKMGVEVQQSPQNYTITGDIISTGILKMFVNHTSHTVVSGTGANFSYSTINYETHYQTRKKRKSAKMRYVNGTVAQEEVTPPDNRAVRPAVSAEMKKGSSDPLSLVLAMRQGLFEARKHNKQNYSVNIYDGRRLTELDYAVIGPRTIVYHDANVPVIEVNVSRKFLAGFTASELPDASVQEPPLHIYFSDDARLMPLALEVTLWMGTLSAELAHECAPNESCLLGIKD